MFPPAGWARVCQQHGEGADRGGRQPAQGFWSRPLLDACRHATGAHPLAGSVHVRCGIPLWPVACYQHIPLQCCSFQQLRLMPRQEAARNPDVLAWSPQAALLTAACIVWPRGSRRPSPGYPRCRTPGRWSCRARALGRRGNCQTMGVPLCAHPLRLPRPPGMASPSRVMSRSRRHAFALLVGGQGKVGGQGMYRIPIRGFWPGCLLYIHCTSIS